MNKGILGKKIGMSQVFTTMGRSIPVTVIEVLPNFVTKVLTKEKQGYQALQLATRDKKEKNTNKSQIGIFKKLNITPKAFVREIRNMDTFKLGDKISVSEIFSSGEFVDVQGISKGKGFAGAIKRHNQKIGPKSHGGGGGSKPIRQTGSIGDITGNRVYKGMTMPGRLGGTKTTMQNLEVIESKDNLLLLKGSIPGPKNSMVIIKTSIKIKKNKAPIEMANTLEIVEKNHLLEEAKKYGASLNIKMTIEEMKKLIQISKSIKEKEEKEKSNNSKLVSLKIEITALEEQHFKTNKELESSKGDEQKSLRIKEKLKILESQIEELKEKMSIEGKEGEK